MVRLFFGNFNRKLSTMLWHDVIMPERLILGYITRLAFRSVAEKKKVGCCSISFLVHPGRSPGIMLLCLSASRIYNTLAISLFQAFR